MPAQVQLGHLGVGQQFGARRLEHNAPESITAPCARWPGPPARSARPAGSSGRSRLSCEIVSNTAPRAFGSSPVEGSSIRISRGSSISARAISTIFCSPPESDPARSPARSRTDGNRSATSSARRRTSARSRTMYAPISTLSQTVIPGTGSAPAARAPRPGAGSPRRRAADLAVQGDPPGARAQQAADRLQHRRLAGAVRADQAGDRPRLQRQVDAAQHVAAP